MNIVKMIFFLKPYIRIRPDLHFKGSDTCGHGKAVAENTLHTSE